MKNSGKETWVVFFSLFTSVGTLICCALPALMVTLGLGAVLAGLVTNLPWLVALSEHKMPVFIVAFLMLSFASFLQWRSRLKLCPIDTKKALLCAKMRRVSWCVLGVSWIIYLIGFFFAFIAIYVLS